jgi:hypothetical protein
MAVHGAVREHLIDAIKASPLIGYVVGLINGIDWGKVGTFWMAIYAILLVMDKCGLLAPLKAFGVRVTGPLRRLGRRLFHPGKPSA